MELRPRLRSGPGTKSFRPEDEMIPARGRNDPGPGRRQDEMEFWSREPFRPEDEMIPTRGRNDVGPGRNGGEEG